MLVIGSSQLFNREGLSTNDLAIGAHALRHHLLCPGHAQIRERVASVLDRAFDDGAFVLQAFESLICRHGGLFDCRPFIRTNQCAGFALNLRFVARACCASVRPIALRQRLGWEAR